MPAPSQPVDDLVFAATVPATMRGVVERLFFMNERQAAFLERIAASIERSGTPRIEEDAGRLWLAVPAAALQCLFACRPGLPPVAVALYGRPAFDRLEIVHLAVDPAHAPGAGVRLVEQIRQLARSISGVTLLQLPYSSGRCLRVS